jgi:hypothetical protein
LKLETREISRTSNLFGAPNGHEMKKPINKKCNMTECDFAETKFCSNEET